VAPPPPTTIGGTPIAGNTGASPSPSASRPIAAAAGAGVTAAGTAAGAATSALAPTASQLDPQPAAPSAGDATLSRAEVKAALADFSRLVSAIQGELSSNGLKITALADRSIFARAGLRKGDTVTAVDGKPLQSIDDAADIYSRAGTARAMSVSIIRHNKPATLRIVIQ